MWSSHTTGELHPMPGMGVFQTTFSVSLQVSGRLGSSGIAPAFGPRNLGHCSVWAAPVSDRSINPRATIKARYMVFLPADAERIGRGPPRDATPGADVAYRTGARDIQYARQNPGLKPEAQRSCRSAPAIICFRAS